MKTYLTSDKEQQHATLPKLQKEPNVGSTTTIVDNRPFIIHQRKLQETMNAHATRKAWPVQRKAPRGSSRFQKIALAMGKKYGVDTSGLIATHNSSFPGKLNAEATIVGNKIDFGPGNTNDYNIKHEVAHAIDNTLNGTPKGDQWVNGYKVDSSRENVVDQMAKASIEPTGIKQPKGHGTFNQGKVKVIQRKPANTSFNKNKLNVIGEDHFKYEKDPERRQAEKNWVESQGMEYLLEEQIYTENKSGKSIYRIYGDAAYLRLLFDLYYLRERCKDAKPVVMDVDQVDQIDKKDDSQRLADLQTLLEDSKLDSITNLEEIFEEFVKWDLAKDHRLYRSNPDNFNDNQKLFILYEEKYKKEREISLGQALVSIKEIFEECEVGFKAFMVHENPKSFKKKTWNDEKELLGYIKAFIKALETSHTRRFGSRMKWLESIIGFINDFFEKKCPFLSNETRKGIASQSLGEFEVYGNQHSLSWLRSEYMKQYAEANCNRKAVWKVGDKHVDDIEKIEGKNYHRKYNLIKMGYFESKIFRYTSRGGHFRKLGGFFKQ
ncbi:MAG: hypothetical protein MJA30_03295 [Cytophagales bacterium]|nr:hypothetical protein [Cytophagales bacterium]